MTFVPPPTGTRRHLSRPAPLRNPWPLVLAAGLRLRRCRGRQEVVVEYLLVDTEGRILAVLQSGAAVARQLARIEEDPEAIGPVRVVRHDEHHGDLVSTESFVTANLLPSSLGPPRPR